jgi:Cys-tRNA(Pro)/Cys-tRNA(Cys) deacylase
MKPIAITPATKALDSQGLTYTLHKYESSVTNGFGDEAATSMEIAPERVFKTILFTDSAIVVVGVSPVSAEISSKKLAAAAGVRNLTSASVQLAERVTGYVVGGISPFGQRQQHVTVMDESALNFTTIYVSGGRRGLEIEIAPQDLMKSLQAICAPIAALDAAKKQ